MSLELIIKRKLLELLVKLKKKESLFSTADSPFSC